jgi:hypothetical protein
MTIKQKGTWPETSTPDLNIQWTWASLSPQGAEITSQAKNAAGTALNPKIQKILNSDLEGWELVALITDWNIRIFDNEIVELLKNNDLVKKLVLLNKDR